LSHYTISNVFWLVGWLVFAMTPKAQVIKAKKKKIESHQI
jgi:hypothetical protein